ncbi:MAG: IS630 transposase-related protein [Alphaproteobacteria bacterium]
MEMTVFVKSGVFRGALRNELSNVIPQQSNCPHRRRVSKREAARIFKLSPNAIYLWLNSTDLSPRHSEPRNRKIDKEALKQHIEKYPDLYLRERAGHFNVSIPAMWKIMRKLGS